MTYAIYRNQITKDAFYQKWGKEKADQLSQELKDFIYDKYVLKCEVFTRDSFMCQNEGCGSKDKLTLHHVKWQKNGGKNAPRNTVTICDSCHKAYHRAKRELKFSKAPHLPDHIRGHTFKLERSDEINWKEIKKRMKALRKNIKDQCGIPLSDYQVMVLWTFLFKDW
jgi:hypothetical protein